MTGSTPDALRVGYVPGVIVSKWERVWAERFPERPLALVAVPQADQETAIHESRVDMCFVRLPIDRAKTHAIPLYEERPVAVIPTDHPISLYEEITLADLADERLQDATDLDALADTVALVAAVGGAAVMPQSLARLHHRRDLTYRPLTDAEPTAIALAWLIDNPNEAIEDFIGVVRGRTARSSRTPRTEPVAPQRNNKRPEAARKKQPAGRPRTAKRRGR
ncbi:LysR substrate-binding domain-containing protein [Nocardia sp. NPDC003482]